MRNWKSFDLLILSFVAGLAAYVCTNHLTAHSFNNDEIAILWHQSFNIQRLLYFSNHWAYHPPLYLFVLKGWTNIFGSSEYDSRMLSVVFFVGICLLPYFYRKTFSFSWWIFSLLLITSYPLLALSRMVLPYSLACMLLMASWLQLRSWKLTPTKINSLLMVFFVTLCFYTHYLAWGFVILLYALTFCELLLARDYSKVRKYLICAAAHILLVLNWYLWSPSLQEMISGKNKFWNPSQNLFYGAEEIYSFIFSESYSLVLLWLMVVTGGFLLVRKNRKDTLILGMSMVLYSAYVLYRSASNYNYLIPRYFLWFAPVIYFLYLTNLPKRFHYFFILLFLGITLKQLPPVYDLSWDDAQSPFSYSSMQGQGKTCDKPITLFWYNTQWYKPYLKRYGRCPILERNERICLHSFDTLLKTLPPSGLVIYHQAFCKHLFEPMILLNPEKSGILYFKEYRLLILGQSKEKYLEEIFKIPGLSWP